MSEYLGTMTQDERQNLYMFGYSDLLCVSSRLGEALPPTPEEKLTLESRRKKNESKKEKLKEQLLQIEDELKKYND